MKLASFSRDFLTLISKDNASTRRCAVALRAAAKRWPNGRIVKSRSRNSDGTRTTVTRYMVGDYCALLIETGNR